MSTVEIIGGVLLLLASIGIIALVSMQESSKQSGTSALTGGDSFYSQNQGRTKDVMLSKATRTLGAVLFIVTIAVYAIVARS